MQRLAPLFSLFLVAPAAAQTWTETGDAGAFPDSAQLVGGAGTLAQIDGTLDSQADVDMYRIRITDYQNFVASTVGGATFDTQLWLFNLDGTGVTHRDDMVTAIEIQSEITGQFVPGDGEYLLAITHFDVDPRDQFLRALWFDFPFDTEHAPDGFGASDPIASWTGIVPGTPPAEDYSIFLEGASFIGGETLRNSRKPGSVLVFPVHRSGGPWITILNVSNTSTLPDGPQTFGGSTNAHFEYVNVQPNPTADVNPLAKFLPAGCTIFDRVEFMTPADHISVLTTCHNAFAGEGQEGYVVVSAENPAAPMGSAWLHNYLMGSEVVMSAAGVTYMVNAISIQGIGRSLDEIPELERAGLGGHHDSLTSGSFPYTLEFDGWHYAQLPDCLMSDFLGVGNSQLALINFTGGPNIENTLHFEVYNDNELPLSATLRFRCWFDQPLECVSPLFSEASLDGFPNDPEELDITCDGVGDLETGWFKIYSTGTWFPSGVRHSEDGAIHGSITAGHASVRGGHLLWEQGYQDNGAFRTP